MHHRRHIGNSAEFLDFYRVLLKSQSEQGGQLFINLALFSDAACAESERSDYAALDKKITILNQYHLLSNYFLYHIRPNISI